MAILLSILCILLAVLLFPLIKLGKIYHQARAVGFPVVISAIDQTSMIWRLFRNRLTPLVKYLPFGLGKYAGYGNFFHDRYATHERLGPIFTIASTGGLIVVIADADTVDDVLARRKDFIKQEPPFNPLQIFGPNVVSLNGEGWQRHRRLTTPPFNERNSSLVWRESITQAKGMMKSWMSTGLEGVSKTTNDTMTLALHVLTAAGFGKSYDFEGGVTKLSGDHKVSHKDALRTILGNINVAHMVKTNQVPAYVPESFVAEVSTALTEFRQYMEEMIDDEKARIGTNLANDNLMSVLVHASEAEARGHQKRDGLTKEEMFGNLFIYNFAGHDTTANTIGYAIYMMASDPKWQTWIREELDSVFGGEAGLGEDDYGNAFPKLKRCLALMNETLRVYGPIVVMPKTTGADATSIESNGKTHNLPPNTIVLVNVTALNSCPQYWGSDALTWRPDRWIVNTKSSTGMEGEDLIQLPTGRFVPWGSGPRHCPGKKFSQVEFVAVMASLFRQHRVVPVRNEGEDDNDVKKRIWETVEDSNLFVTLKMNHPERVKLVWEKL